MREIDVRSVMRMATGSAQEDDEKDDDKAREGSGDDGPAPTDDPASLVHHARHEVAVAHRVLQLLHHKTFLAPKLVRADLPAKPNVPAHYAAHLQSLQDAIAYLTSATASLERSVVTSSDHEEELARLLSRWQLQRDRQGTLLVDIGYRRTAGAIQCLEPCDFPLVVSEPGQPGGLRVELPDKLQQAQSLHLCFISPQDTTSPTQHNDLRSSPPLSLLHTLLTLTPSSPLDQSIATAQHALLTSHLHTQLSRAAFLSSHFNSSRVSSSLILSPLSHSHSLSITLSPISLSPSNSTLSTLTQLRSASLERSAFSALRFVHSQQWKEWTEFDFKAQYQTNEPQANKHTAH